MGVCSREDDEVAVGGDGGGEGEIIGIAVGATVNYGVCRVKVVGLILGVVEFNPGIGKVGVRAACF